MTGETVLIVDDDTDVRESLKAALELEGYNVFAAGNGKEALELIPNIPNPSLILLDLMMPVMNGWEFLKALSENYGFAGIPVLIITAFSDKFFEKGKVSGILQKPIDLTQLTETVKQYCPSSAAV